YRGVVAGIERRERGLVEAGWGRSPARALGGARGVALPEDILRRDRLPEQGRRESGEGLGAALFGRDGRRGPDGDEFAGSEPGVRLEPADETSDLGGQRAAVAVDLVEDEVAKRPREELPVLAPHEQEIELLVVREEDV